MTTNTFTTSSKREQIIGHSKLQMFQIWITSLQSNGFSIPKLLHDFEAANDLVWTVIGLPDSFRKTTKANNIAKNIASALFKAYKYKTDIVSSYLMIGKVDHEHVAIMKWLETNNFLKLDCLGHHDSDKTKSRTTTWLITDILKSSLKKTLSKGTDEDGFLRFEENMVIVCEYQRQEIIEKNGGVRFRIQKTQKDVSLEEMKKIWNKKLTKRDYEAKVSEYNKARRVHTALNKLMNSNIVACSGVVEPTFDSYQIVYDEVGSPTRNYNVFQSIPNRKDKLRNTITFNGQETVEEDFVGLHIQVLYGQLGISMPLNAIGTCDPYVLNSGKYNRKHVKTLAQCLVNSKTLEQAVNGMYYKGNSGLSISEITSMTEEFCIQHEKIVHLLFRKQTKNTPSLMNIDGNIALSIIEWAIENNIMIIPIHDSFRVSLDHLSALKQQMVIAYQNEIEKYQDIPTEITEIYTQTTYADGSESPKQNAKQKETNNMKSSHLKTVSKTEEVEQEMSEVILGVLSSNKEHGLSFTEVINAIPEYKIYHGKTSHVKSESIGNKSSHNLTSRILETLMDQGKVIRTTIKPKTRGDSWSYNYKLV